MHTNSNREQIKLYIETFDKELKKVNLSKEDRTSIELAKYELEEFIKFKDVMYKIGTIAKKSESRINEEKLTSEEKEKISDEALDQMEKLFIEHETKSVVINNRDDVITKNIFKKKIEQKQDIKKYS